jgi:nucleoside-diphosphate-sugar epimerase
MASYSSDKAYCALVFGASGITGWAIMNNAVTYPSPNTFERIVGLTNRPLSKEDSCIPQDPRIELYSGIDLSKKDTLIGKLQQVHEIEKITHVYFAAYTSHGSDYKELKRANVEILKNAVEAIEQLCPKLLFFTLQTGGKVSLHLTLILTLTFISTSLPHPTKNLHANNFSPIGIQHRIRLRTRPPQSPL